VLVKARMDKFRSDVLTATGHHDRVHAGLRRYLASLMKTLNKDRAFLIDVLPTGGSGADGDGDLSNSTTSSVATASGAHLHRYGGAKDASPTPDSTSTTGRQAFRRYLADLVAAFATELSTLLQSTDNLTTLISLLELVHADFVIPLLTTLLPAAESRSAEATAGRYALARDVLAPFATQTPSLVKREVDHVNHKVSVLKTPADFAHASEAIAKSATTITTFVQTLLGGAKEAGLRLPEAANASRAALETLSAAWSQALQDYSGRIVESLPIAGATPAGGGGGGLRESLETALDAYAKCVKMPAQVMHLQDEVKAALVAMQDKLAVEDADALHTQSLTAHVLARAVTAVSAVPANCREKVLSILLGPVGK
jgi:hypothetical protein